MTPPGKIIDIDAFKQKDESFSSAKTPKDKKQVNPSVLRKEIFYAGILVVLVSLTLAYMMTPAKKRVFTPPPVGAIADMDIKATEDMLVVDEESTEKNRSGARNLIADVYDFDDKVALEVAKNIDNAFAYIASAYITQAEQAYQNSMERLSGDRQQKTEEEAVTGLATDEKAELARRLSEEEKSLRRFENSDGFNIVEAGFMERLGVELDEKALKSARYYHYWPKIGVLAKSALTEAFAKGILTSKKELPPSSVAGITLRRLSTGKESSIRTFEDILDKGDAIKSIIPEISGSIREDRPGLKRLALQITSLLMQPNVTFNKLETSLRKEEAGKKAPPVFFQVQKGEMIVREGERLTPAHFTKLSAMAGTGDDRGRLAIFLGFFAVNLVIAIMSAFFLQKFHEEIQGDKKLQLLMSLLVVGHIGLIQGINNGAALFIPQTPGLGLDSYMLAAPLVFGPMVASIFFTTELTLIFTIIVSALTGLLLREMTILPLLTILGGLICAYQVRSYQRRASILKVGLAVALMNVLVTQSFDTIGARFLSESRLHDVAFAFTGGALAALLVSALAPLIESFFPVVSDIKLLELSSLNHPLMRRLIMEAPGTYHHSIMVGALSEQACKSIGANDLLARVGALFHDIGKLKKPQYFSENQRKGEENPHDRLTPSMSYLIIVNHIKEGQELARQYKLLPQIAAMIPEHQGTQLVKYFYSKAKESQDISRGEVKESDFCYPGPIPGSRESACVALADSLEAAARACQNPTPLRIRGLVTEVINDKFVQGQLDNSHLTLHDLAEIAESFTHSLTHIHHSRIQYPEAVTDKDKKNPNASNPDQQKEAKGNARNLRA